MRTIYKSYKTFHTNWVFDLIALKSCAETPIHAIRLLGACKTLSPHDLWTHGKEIVGSIKSVIQPDVPRRVQGKYARIDFVVLSKRYG